MENVLSDRNICHIKQKFSFNIYFWVKFTTDNLICTAISMYISVIIKLCLIKTEGEA